MTIDKSLLSNAAAAAVIAAGYLLPGTAGELLLSTGLFALSGAVTNWLAIHMLFERVPGLYGSGIIPLRFEEFKSGIRELIMEQFFDRVELEEVLGSQGANSAGGLDKKVAAQVQEAIDEVDLDQAFERLLDVILASSFGGMLGMLGGRDALAGLREPFAQEMRDYLAGAFTAEDIERRVQALFSQGGADDSLRQRIENLIDGRLNEMTPQVVKEVVQKMIKAHLGWLVVWGAVFGGGIGLIVSLLAL
jgi:uncharacterized membrane protein YheB (UPF0754 family)